MNCDSLKYGFLIYLVVPTKTSLIEVKYCYSIIIVKSECLTGSLRPLIMTIAIEHGFELEAKVWELMSHSWLLTVPPQSMKMLWDWSSYWWGHPKGTSFSPR